MKLVQFKKERVINLDNVSNISIDSNTSKVIFNMNYSVKIFNNRYTPDYVYWNYTTEKELTKIKEALIESTFGWIQPVGNNQKFVNPSNISTITLAPRKNRVIINLNYNITHPNYDNKLTSDFVFYDFEDVEAYSDFKDNILSITEQI